MEVCRLRDGVRGEKVLNSDWQLAYSNASSVVYSCGDSRRNSSQADLPNTARSVLAHNRIRYVKKVDVYLGCVRDRRNDVIRKIVVDGMPVTRIVDRLFKQTHSDSHHNRARDLVRRRALVDDAPSIDDADDPAHAQLCNSRIPFDLGELCSKGVRRVIARFGIRSQPSRLSVTIHAGKVRHAQNLLERHPGLW